MAVNEADIPECGCLTHTGSHDEHMDRLDKERNQKLLATLQDESQDPIKRYLAGLGFMTEEQARLERKAYALRRSNS